MRVLAALAALSFAVGSHASGHPVTLRFDTVAPNQSAKIELKSPVAGLHLNSASAPGAQQLSITTPASVVVDGNVEALMVDAENGAVVRVSFEQGGSQRELALRIVGTKLMLRRNMDGDLVLGTRVLQAPGRE